MNCKKGQLLQLRAIFLGHLQARLVSCFLVSAPSSYHPLSITSSVSICLRRANYGTYHLGLYQFPPAAIPSFPAIPTPPSRSLQSHQHVLPSFFIPHNVFFSPLPHKPISFLFFLFFLLLSPLVLAVPSLF